MERRRVLLFSAAAIAALCIGAMMSAPAYAVLLAYEPFDYTVPPGPGTAFLHGATGATDFGFGGVSGLNEWNNGALTAPLPSNTGQYRLARGSLQYGGTGAPTARGNSAGLYFETAGSAFADRQLSFAFGDDTFGTLGSTYYVGFNWATPWPASNGSLKLGTDGSAATLGNAVPVTIAAAGTSTNNTAMGFYGGHIAQGSPPWIDGQFGLIGPSGQNATNSVYSAANHYPVPQTIMYVAEITVDGTAGGGDRFRVFMNPTSTPLSGTVVGDTAIPSPGGVQLGTYNEIRLTQNNSMQFDEIRIGTTWADMFSTQSGGGMTPQVVTTPGPGTVVTARAIRDATMGSGNDGGGSAILARANGGGQGNAVIKFQDLNTLIPSGATITGARLVMEKNHFALDEAAGTTGVYNEGANTGTPGVYDSHIKVWRVGEDWTEGSGHNAGGAAAGGVTKTSRDGTNAWSTVEGTYYGNNGVQVTGFSTNPQDATNWYARVTPATAGDPGPLDESDGLDAQNTDLDVTQLVQEWWDFIESGGTSGFQDFGILLTQWNLSGGSLAVNFMSKESPVAYANGTEAHLVITYELQEAEVVPEPSTIALGLMGLVGLVSAGWVRRQRRKAA